MVEIKKIHLDMKTTESIEQMIHKGKIDNELDLERALIADKKLRTLSKDNSHFKNLRKKLRDIIEDYENNHWSDINKIDENQINESEFATFIAEQESAFIEKRKTLIKNKLQENQLNQQELGMILGHKSKTHMSELMNGISPFSLKDLILINRLLKIEITELVPIFLSLDDQKRVKSVLNTLNKPQIKLSKEDLVLV